MSDLPLVAARAAVFLAAAALLSAPAQALMTDGGPSAPPRGAALGFFVAGGLLFGLQVRALQANPEAWPDPATARTVLSVTGFGRAFVVRSLLCLWLAAAAPPRDQRLRFGMAACASGALCFNGHGAAGVGWAGVVRLGLDAVHLVAGLTWVGLLGRLAGGALVGGEPGRRRTAALLDRFAWPGGALVLVLAVAGGLHLAFFSNEDPLRALAGSVWGRELALNVGLFGMMLALAALNRFALSRPAGGALGAPLRRAPAAALVAEAVLGLCVLALVADLGVRPPAG